MESTLLKVGTGRLLPGVVNVIGDWPFVLDWIARFSLEDQQRIAIEKTLPVLVRDDDGINQVDVETGRVQLYAGIIFGRNHIRSVSEQLDRMALPGSGWRIATDGRGMTQLRITRGYLVP